MASAAAPSVRRHVQALVSPLKRRVSKAIVASVTSRTRSPASSWSPPPRARKCRLLRGDVPVFFRSDKTDARTASSNCPFALRLS